MNRINQENLKSYILITLIITSLIQIGILWNYQYQNIPINLISSFFVNLFDKNYQAPPLEAEEYLKPYRIIVSEGVDDSHWAIYKNDEAYNLLWNDFKTNYMVQVLSTNPVQTYPQDQWGSIIKAKAFTFEYKTNINYEIFTGFIGVKDLPSNRPTGIYKVMISPWEDINYNLTVYIMDETRIYKYVLPIKDNALSRDADSKSFGSIINKLQDEANLRDYMYIKELNIGKSAVAARPDLLCVAKGSKASRYSSLKDISILLPDWLTLKGKNDLDTIAQNVLHNERGNYDSSTDNNDTRVLRNSNNIFKVYSSGILEYKYLSDPEVSERGLVFEAFKRAEEFIGQRSNLISGVGINIYLSGVSVNKENKEMYDFTFDYTVGNMPIVFNFDPKDGDGAVIKNAVSITADSKRVFSCRLVIRNVVQDKEADLYNTDFDNIFKEINTENKTDNKIATIKDWGVGYDIESNTANNLLPVWIVTSEKNENFPIEMQRK